MLAAMLFAVGVGAGCSAVAPTQDATFPVCTTAAGDCLDHLELEPGRTVPFYRNFSLTTANPTITEAIIVIHGSSRDAGNYFQTILTATSQSGTNDQTIIVSPHFQCAGDPAQPGELVWPCDGSEDWSHGGRDTNRASAPIYSYAVIDQIIVSLTSAGNFPNLKKIVVTGLSAGGQLTQRYAATNPLDPIAGVDLEYLVLSPSSYVYLDANRLEDQSHCPRYDDYHYGLQNRTGYVAIPGIDQVRSQYVSRKVSYLVGDQDTLGNASGTGLDTSCEANAQGADRVARAINFSNVLRQTYRANHPLVVVPGCGHSRTCMYYSLEARRSMAFISP